MDYSEILLKIKKLTKDFHEATLKKRTMDAYKLSVELNQQAQELEKLMAKLAND